MGSALLAALGHWFHTPPETRKGIRLALNLFWITNLFLFLIWVFYSPRDVEPFPWFIYPLFTLALPLVLWRMKNVHKESRIWPYVGTNKSLPLASLILTVLVWLVVSILIMLNLLLFLTFMFVPGSFPCT